MEGYQPTSKCAECGGECCKEMPGSVVPQDLGKDVRSRAKEMLESGDYQLDWWEGDVTGGERDRSLYMRPSVVGNRDLQYGSWGNDPCVFLTATGCRLPFEDRPHGCRMLEPTANGCICHSGHTSDKENAAIQWYPLNDMLEEICREIEENQK